MVSEVCLDDQIGSNLRIAPRLLNLLHPHSVEILVLRAVVDCIEGLNPSVLVLRSILLLLAC